jgi:hypothetical protein
LLSEATDEVVADLASAQDDAAGREAVARLGAILARAREAGVEVATLEYRMDYSPEARAHRLEEERRSLRNARRGTLVKAPDGPDAGMLATGRAFDSLAECLEHIRATYPQGTTAMTARDVAARSDTDPHSWDAPRVLFRGESGLFPSTPTSLARLLSDLSLPVATIETVIAVAIRVRTRLEQQFGLSPRLAAGFLQHYGLPTHFLDLSSDLDIAVQFATDLAVGDWGALAVFPMEALSGSDSFVLADLTRHPMADRPRRQSAYAYLDYVHSDLKDPAAVAERRVAWHWFRFTAEDEERHQPDPYLLDAHSDRVAGVIELLINDCAKFDDEAARWIAARVPAAPMALRVTGHDESGATGILIPADEAGEQLLGSNSELNYRRWSSAVPEPAPMDTAGEGAPLTSSTEDPLRLGATVWVL